MSLVKVIFHERQELFSRLQHATLKINPFIRFISVLVHYHDLWYVDVSVGPGYA